MRRAILGIVIVVAAGVAACSNQAPAVTGPSGLVGIPSINQLSSATVTVLDGADPICDGVCIVTKWPLHPTEDWTPTYFVQSYTDPCTTKWGSPWHTYARVDHDDDEWTSAYYWCQQ